MVPHSFCKQVPFLGVDANIDGIPEKCHTEIKDVP